MDPSGLYCLGARYYDPVAGHFLSADPLGQAGSLDLHGFCLGDPVNRFDPTGRFGNTKILTMNQNFLIANLGLQGVTGEFDGATATQIAESEVILNSKFPDDYKSFLREFGASLFTEDVVFEPIEPSPWAVDGNECFDVFYGITKDSGFDICQINSRLKGEIPNGTIAIGHDSGSNKIILCLVTNRVLFFDKDTGATFLVANSFGDFLEAFRRR